MYIYIYIYTYINIYVPSRLSPQWPCGNSCTWAHDVGLYMRTTVRHVSKCMSCHKVIVMIRGGHSVFMITYTFCSSCHLASVKFEHSVCRGSLMYIYIYFSKKLFDCGNISFQSKVCIF